jgi:predicted RNA binding protein YcfA (HicA-like mRNA interferase family)
VPKLPIISGSALVKSLKKAVFEEVRQRGSHVTPRKGEYKTVVPLHDELAPGTLLGIMKQCGLAREELLTFLGK